MTSRPAFWRSAAVIMIAMLLCSPAALFAEDTGGDFAPEKVFTGRSHGVGMLWLGLGRARRFEVASIGTLQPDGALRVDQRVRYADGATQSRHWTLRRYGTGAYTTTLSDAHGPVRLRIDGRTLMLDYRLHRPGVTMRQVMELSADRRSIANVGSIRFLGIPIGRLEETIRLQQ